MSQIQDAFVAPPDGALVRLPDADTPERQHLRQQVHNLEDLVNQTRETVIHQAENYLENRLETQRHGFERAAEQYQQQARDINRAELANNAAVLETQMMSTLTETERRAQQSLDSQRTAMVAEAQDAFATQRAQLVGEAESTMLQQQHFQPQRLQRKSTQILMLSIFWQP